MQYREYCAAGLTNIRSYMYRSVDTKLGQPCERLRVSLEREKGIEPSPQAWEARVLPLNYSRSEFSRHRVAPGFGCAQQAVAGAVLRPLPSHTCSSHGAVM